MTTKPQTTKPNHLKAGCFINAQLNVFSSVCQNLAVNKEKQPLVFLTTLQCVSLSLCSSLNYVYKRKFQLYVSC